MNTIWQRVHSYCSSMLPPKPDHPSLPESVGPDDPHRRREPRQARGEPCEFALTHADKVDEVVCEEGTGMTVNMSRSGMQLLLGVAPQQGQWLEVHLNGNALQRSVSLLEVCWTKPVRDDAHGRLYLVGGRVTFGPSRYVAF